MSRSISPVLTNAVNVPASVCLALKRTLNAIQTDLAIASEGIAEREDYETWVYSLADHLVSNVVSS